MKLTKSKLQQIIREELGMENPISEQPDAPPAPKVSPALMAINKAIDMNGAQIKTPADYGALVMKVVGLPVFNKHQVLASLKGTLLKMMLPPQAEAPKKGKQ